MKTSEPRNDLHVVSNERVFKEAAKRMREIYFIKNRQHVKSSTFAFVFEDGRFREIVELDYEPLYEMQTGPRT